MGREPEASGCPYPPRGACSGVAGEVVRRRRARAVARTVEEGEDDRGEWAGLAWASWLGWAEAHWEARGSGPFPLFLLSLFLFPAAFAFFFLANKDFAKIMPLAKIISKKYIALPQKYCETLEKECQFYKLKRHLIYCLGHCFK